jgi:hypothetical protein
MPCEIQVAPEVVRSHEIRQENELQGKANSKVKGVKEIHDEP